MKTPKGCMSQVNPATATAVALGHAQHKSCTRYRWHRTSKATSANVKHTLYLSKQTAVESLPPVMADSRVQGMAHNDTVQASLGAHG
jgi:hypothetical protein